MAFGIDRIADQLPGAVVRDVAAAADSDEVCADLGRIAAQVGGQVGVLAIREHMVVFEQQEVLLAAVVEQRLLDGERLAAPAPAIGPARRRAASGAGHVRARPTSPGLEDLLDLLEEAGGVGAVEGAVVPAHRQVADRMDGDRPAPSAVCATTGRRTMASVEMMPTWGWLMIGIVSTSRPIRCWRS